ncbi:MAG: argininosuccinate lyase [Cyclobacteriaceae bacterium]|nr:argininosuccinate lyase [Cyclobacteriaceae bacterium]MCB0498118.1 argininosuccinate lyase [Cyclobacteriaceae bacterium]MCB9238842.1 argininosuccinate lyase [Flammeovirgaceae bacterium]MCO5270561.1 argininosuccinate lyase [Cyclobacteriaceae bacterium]MCW5900998.1 argininosuccinate lyase [Cyclobacteriaceae bacterium]
MKLWQKNKDALKEVSQFTVGQDKELDLFLAPFDVIGSLAHIQMLASIGLLEKTERDRLAHALKEIYKEIQNGGFKIDEGVEDIHSQVELMLTARLGALGKKIHSGRSRNDQVLLDIKLFLRNGIQELVGEIKSLFDLLLTLSERHKGKLLPGYTHLQLAMPSSFGLWFGAYAESLVDDVATLHGAYKVANKNPLGSAAGYGSSLPLNRKMTTELLGFGELNYNVVYAQMGRGKTEKIVAAAIGNVAATLGKLSMDACLYLNQNFDFISFPEELTTGSSIMPHKKNPDVFELVRGRCNDLQALPHAIALATSNLPSGYHRDLQLLKEKLFPAFGQIMDCLQMVRLMLSHIEVKEGLLEDEKYKYLFSVEEVNQLVLQGIPFRDAYGRVGQSIERGEFKPIGKIHHTHEGSMGNLCNDEISKMMDKEIQSFQFDVANGKVAQLLS